MKTIGLIGGISWESTAEYYRLINQAVRERLGGLHSAKLVAFSVDFEPVAEAQHRGDWDEVARVMIDAGRLIERAGAELALICANTIHKVYDRLAEALEIPLIHIADATGREIVRASVSRVGLIGTRFTMEDDFYAGRLERRFGLETIVPQPADRELVHRVIYDELCRGVIRDESRESYARIIGRLVEAGAEAVILGCTEIPLLIGPEDSPVPLFDTTAIHARLAVESALA